MNQIYRELELVPELRDIGAALVQFAESISGSSPIWETEQWVFRPSNFVTFRIQYKRDRSIKLSLRGHPDEFLNIDGLELRDNMGNGAYSVCKITRRGQLAAAALHIRQAYNNYVRGRHRTRQRPTLT